MANNNPIVACPPTKKPATICLPSGNFGVPRGSSGRHGHSVQGIVIHCVDKTVEEYDNLACKELKLKGLTEDHASVHFYVNRAGIVREYIDMDDTAWGFPSQLVTPAPNFNTFNWQLILDNPGVPIDYYTIQIAVEKSLFKKADGCDNCDSLYCSLQYKRLIQLIAWIQEQFPAIVFDKDHIQFHGGIDAMAEGECGDCADIDQILCDAEEYCEAVNNPGDPSMREADASEPLVKFYGEDRFGEKRWSFAENMPFVQISNATVPPAAGVENAPVIVKIGTGVWFRDVTGAVLQII